MDISKIFGKERDIIIGMVHCLPLPGMPAYCGQMDEIIRQAVEDAKTLERAGCSGVIVENMGDSPMAECLDLPQQIALALVTDHVKRSVSIPVGVDAAFNDYRANFSICKATKASFVRIPVFVDTVAFTDGILSPVARQAMLYRKELCLEEVAILADIQVKHSYMLVPSVSIEDSARNAQACGADAIIVTGSYVGAETPIEIIQRVRKVIDLPLIIASGVKPENIKEQMEIANGAIIGSSLKVDGILSNPISAELCAELFDALNAQENKE